MPHNPQRREFLDKLSIGYSRANVRIPLQIIVGAVVFVGLCIGSVFVVHYNGWGFANKNLFNWLEILVFPLAIGVGVPWLTSAQRAQRERDQAFQEHQRELELEIENQRAQDTAFQSYLDQIGDLLINHQLQGLEETTERRVFARTSTLATLNRLEGVRKREVLQFLVEANLIHKHHPLINLGGANLRNAALRGTDLRETDLSEADLSEADLSSANLSGANLSLATLVGADLREAFLTGADLSRATLFEANLADEQLADAQSLQGATMPNGQKYEEWLKSNENGKNE
jgi:uncharacterized protein YjbI with pentapeptide repeats